MVEQASQHSKHYLSLQNVNQQGNKGFVVLLLLLCCFCTGGGVLSYSLGGGVPLGLRKSYPLLDQILQIL